ncbi:MAG: nucleotide sugar dehydrogenase [Planctomycetota bacterium]
MSNAFETLKSKLESGDALAAVVGMGYVGLPLASSLHRGGLRVLGLDIDPAKIEALEKGENYLKHLGDEMTSELASSNRFEASADFSRQAEADVVIVCLPTPLGRHREPDLSYVVASGESIGKYLRAGQLISLESTTYPGTTRGEFLEAIKKGMGESGTDLACGEDYFVAYSPEREDPGRKDHTTSTIPKLVGGLDDRATDLAVQMYAKGIANVHRVESAEIAEAAKLLENIFRAVNIALVNEMKTVMDGLGIDVWKVIDAASTKPFGFMRFTPGPGLGGHCIPIDPFYLSWKAREAGVTTRFIELAGEVNTAMPAYVINRAADALNERGKAVKGSKVLVMGLAYKPDVDDVRESPAFELIDLLLDRGAMVDYADPHVPQTPSMRHYDIEMQAVEPTAAALASYDAVLIATDHKAFDYGQVAEHARLVIDTRNAMAEHADAMGDRLVKA